MEEFLPSQPDGSFEFFKIFAFFLLVAFSDFYEPTVSEARQALPPNGFLLLTGWPFTKNVELHLISSTFGLACSGAAPPPAAPPL
ncbi:hypothetical protein A3G16_01205 [Candidatus Curtissbacteria bacterium RIFCSPLOWO2_12_FULL_41_16]|nr:MAG: hypothetical protein A3G16_01205 [Candidatus Curtissbacteria bacterium RIFCSPLOWO2_12_FULL_41_16]